MTVGGFPFCCLSALPLAYFPAPIPLTPFPTGRGRFFCFLMQGASPLASPGLNPGDTGSTLRNRFFWCRRRTPVAVNKNSRKVLGGLGASFKKPPSASPPPASPRLNPGGTGSTLRNRFFWRRRRTPVAVNKNFEKSSWGFGGFFQEAPNVSPTPPLHFSRRKKSGAVFTRGWESGIL